MKKLVAKLDGKVIGTRNSKRDYKAVVVGLIKGRKPEVWSWHGTADRARRTASSEGAHDWTGTGFEGVTFKVSTDVVTEARDYKKEYAKFQSSPKRKKYRAELNKYNRNKGTYGNGDGKDASHKGGKISGYETESKNRGRREKSRKKGSTRKTETVMPTLREFIIQEMNAELDERLSKRWNIVEAGEDPVNSIVNQKTIAQAVKKGDAPTIQKIIGKLATYRRELARQFHMSGTIRKLRNLDGVIKNLVRILVHVKQGGVTEAWGKPEPPAPALQSKEIDPTPVSINRMGG